MNPDFPLVLKTLRWGIRLPIRIPPPPELAFWGGGLVSDLLSPPVRPTAIDLTRTILKESGPKGLYSGLSAAVMRQVTPAPSRNPSSPPPPTHL